MTLEPTFKSGVPTGSHLWAPVPSPDAPRWSEILSNAMGHPAEIGDRRTGILLPLCEDPQAILPLAEHFADTLGALSTGSKSTPYR